MRILLACAAFPPMVKGGGPITSFLHAKALLSAGHDVLVVNVQGNDEEGEYDGVPILRIANLNVYWNYYKPRPMWKKALWHGLENFNPRAYGAMRAAIAKFRPDVVATVSTENVNVATWLAARHAKVPVLHCIHSYFLMCYRGSMFKSGQNCRSQCGTCRAASIGKKYLSRYVDGVHAETHHMIDVHRKLGYFPNARFEVIPGPIEDLKFASNGRCGNVLRVGYIGAHTPNKGIETLADAAQLLGDASVEFVIAGTGDPVYSDTLKARFPKDRTRFLGWVQPDELYEQVDVVVVPSLWGEPFARTIVEAFSRGRPVIGARSGGIPESIREGVNGHVFAPGDASELASLLRSLSVDEFEKLAILEKGAQASAQRYRLARIGAEAGNFYTEITDRFGRRMRDDVPPSGAVSRDKNSAGGWRGH